MSMLAEPKHKQRWSLNPRGNIWANDDKKFGQKMLEKMGWNKGKGLGKCENGMTDIIKVSYKNDSKGIGWNDTDSNWIAHQDEYSAILSGLNRSLQERTLLDEKRGKSSESCKRSEMSLEARSKSFKSRVHYQKFVRGKDVSQYSEQDMESIFGAKLATHGNDESSDDSDAHAETGNHAADKAVHENLNGVQTYKSSTSIADYFALKMKERSQLNQSAAHKDVTLVTGKCKEEKTDKISNLAETEPKRMTKKNIKTVCQSTHDSYSSTSEEESKCLSAGNMYELVSCATLPTESLKKRKYKIEPDSDRKVCVKRLKTCSDEPVTNLVQKSLKTCLKNSSSHCLKTAKKVTFKCSALTTESGITEYSKSRVKKCLIGPAKFDSVLSAFTASPSKGDEELSYETVSKNIAIDQKKRPAEFLNDNSWAVCEKLALKMDHYRKVLDKMHEHVTFSTTNLLEIKGYGNW